MVKGFVDTDIKSYQRVHVMSGFVIGIGSMVALTSILAFPSGVILPILAVLTGVVGLLIVFTSGNKWDMGDNQVDGYKKKSER